MSNEWYSSQSLTRGILDESYERSKSKVELDHILLEQADSRIRFMNQGNSSYHLDGAF